MTYKLMWEDSAGVTHITPVPYVFDPREAQARAAAKEVADRARMAAAIETGADLEQQEIQMQVEDLRSRGKSEQADALLRQNEERQQPPAPAAPAAPAEPSQIQKEMQAIGGAVKGAVKNITGGAPVFDPTQPSVAGAVGAEVKKRIQNWSPKHGFFPPAEEDK